VIAIGLNSIVPGPDEVAGEEEPDVFVGPLSSSRPCSPIPLVEDVHTLATVNELVDGYGEGPVPGERRRLPYIFIAPPERETIGRIACQCFKEHYAGLLDARRSPELAFLGRLVYGDAGPEHGELLSYLFFAPEFAAALIRQGKRDGQQWVEEQHDEGLWDSGPLGRDRGPAATAS